MVFGVRPEHVSPVGQRNLPRTDHDHGIPRDDSDSHAGHHARYGQGSGPLPTERRASARTVGLEFNGKGSDDV